MAADGSREALRVPRDDAAVEKGVEELSLGEGDGRLPSTAPARPPPAQSRLISEGIELVDITERFRAAASTLEPGELVKDDYFTLFESVSALEMMDPKMDSGCVSAEELVDNDGQVTRALFPAEVIGIIDQLLCLEMAWHLGYPLSQTLLTCVYMTGILAPPPRTLAEADYMRRNSAEDVQRSPAHSVLRAYCIALIKTCGDVIQGIKTEVYYEEEDLATNTYNLPFLEGISREEVRHVLQQARARLLDVSHGWPEDAVRALETRLDFREQFMTATELAELRTQPDALRVPWTRMAAAVTAIRDSHGLGAAVPAAFNTKMQGLLASTMPPRPIVQPSFSEALQHWSRLAEDAAEAVSILNYADPQSLLNFVLAFQAKKPQPSVFVRAFVQSLIFSDNIMLGVHSIRQIMDDDLAIVVLPCSILLEPVNDEIEAVRSPRFTMARFMEEFRVRTFPAYLETFQALCQNRSRARRMLCHLLQEWERLQIDVEDMDTHVQAALDELAGHAAAPLSGGAVPPPPPPSGSTLALPLSSWAFFYKLRLMEWVVQLGFELEIYQPDELAGMYWYLSYLAKRRVQHAERIRSFTLRSLGERRRQRGGVAADDEARYTKSLLFLRATMLDASVTWELADALSCVYAALQRTGLVKVPARPFGTDALRYELRMRPFAAVGLPELPSLATFKSEAEQEGNSVATMLAYAEQALGGAKKGCEMLTRFSEQEAFAVHSHARWTAATKNRHKSAIAAGLAVAVLKKEVHRVEQSGGSANAGDNNGTTALRLAAQVPTPDKCYHEWWVVPKVVAAAPAKQQG